MHRFVAYGYSRQLKAIVVQCLHQEPERDPIEDLLHGVVVGATTEGMSTLDLD